MAGDGHKHYKPGEIAWGAEHHIQPVSTYAKTIIVLGLLMGLTIWAATWPLPTVFTNLIAMSIAIAKATLVVMFFMHVKISTPLTRFWAIIGFVWVTLIGFILVDYATRPLDPTIARPWMADPGSSMPKHRGGPLSETADPKMNVNIRPRQ